MTKKINNTDILDILIDEVRKDCEGKYHGVIISQMRYGDLLNILDNAKKRINNNSVKK